MAIYKEMIDSLLRLKKEGKGANVNVNPEHAARMRLQNQFQSGIDIAKYTASIMRKDMDDYDSNPEAYTQSLACWHGFIGQQKLISIKEIENKTKKNMTSETRCF